MEQRDKIFINKRLKSKIDSMYIYKNGSYSIRFKDLEDNFHFSNYETLFEFIRQQERERYADKSLRKGYFLYINEYDETFKYIVECKNGALKLIKEEFVESRDN